MDVPKIEVHHVPDDQIAKRNKCLVDLKYLACKNVVWFNHLQNLYKNFLSHINNSEACPRFYQECVRISKRRATDAPSSRFIESQSFDHRG